MTDEPAEIAAETLPALTPEAERTEGNRIVPNVSGTLPAEEVARITTDLIGALKTVYDPEIPVDIYELGLIYKVDLDDDRNLTIDMTLTAPGCPVAGEMPGWVQDAVEPVAGVKEVRVGMTFDPPWGMDMMTDEARLELGFM